MLKTNRIALISDGKFGVEAGLGPRVLYKDVEIFLKSENLQ